MLKEHEEWQDCVATCPNDLRRASSGPKIRTSRGTLVRLAIVPAYTCMFIMGAIVPPLYRSSCLPTTKPVSLSKH